MQTTISDKIFFKIKEVAAITGIKPYVLRYWQSEFASLNPSKNRGGQRVYKRKDIETVLKIKKLLYEEGYTIAGAKKIIEARSGEELKQLRFDFDRGAFLRVLRELRNELYSLISLMDKGEGCIAKDPQDRGHDRKMISG